VTLELRMYNPTDETESYAIGETYTFKVEPPELPTATVTEVKNEELTFAMNFKADEATDYQKAYYGNWYADFELTVNKDVTFNANGGADGYLSGQYDAWSENWVNVPFEDVTLNAGESLKIMEYASELMGKPGLKLTYNDVYSFVKDFDCGVFFTPEFMVENPDLEVTLELRMYNPTDETESYAIGETYIFKVEPPELPTATVTEVKNEELTFAMNFKADKATDYQLAYYGDWYADFELTVNKDVKLNANGGADGYLSGQYDAWSENWVNVPFEDVTLNAGESLKIMEYASKLMGKPGLKYTYAQVYEAVKDFDCGMFFTPDFLAANPDLTVTLELNMYNPADETENYSISGEYLFTVDGLAVAQNVETGAYYTDLATALADAAKADEEQTVILLQDLDVEDVRVGKGALDLNGHELDTEYLSAFADIIDNSDDNSGLLIVPEGNRLLQKDNEQIPVKYGKGYKFLDVDRFNEGIINGKYCFQAFVESGMHALIKTGAVNTGVNFGIRATWVKADESSGEQLFTYNDNMVTDYLNSYKPATDRYGQMFTLKILNADSFDSLKCEAVIKSELGVEKTVEIN